MRLKRLVVEGFESAAQRVEVDFNDKNMIAFVGDNGSGKSMLSIWAPVFALFGKVRVRTIGEAISTSCGQAYVELDFTVNGNDYRVIRKLPRIGRQEAVLYVYDSSIDDWTPLTSKEVKSTNQHIIDVIGMDYESARSTFIAEQGEYGAFCESGPTARREILTQLLHLEGYEELKDAADEAYKEVATSIERDEASLDEMENMHEVISKGNPEFEHLADEDIEDELEELFEQDQELQKKEAEIAFKKDNAQSIFNNAQEAVAAFHRDKQNRLDAIDRSLNSLSRSMNPSRIANLEKSLERIDEGKLHLSNIVPQIADLDKRISKGKQMILDIEETLESTQEEASERKSELSVFSASLVELDQQEADLKKSAEHGARCTTCSQSLSPQLLKTVLDGIIVRRQQLHDQAHEVETQIEELRQSYMAEREDLRVKKGWLEKYESDKSQLSQNRAAIDQMLQSEDSLRMELSQARKDMEDALTEMDALKAERASVEASEVPAKLLRDMEDARKHLEVTEGSEQANFDYSARNRIAELEREVAHRDTVRQNEARFDARRQEIQTRLDQSRKQAESYSILRKAFAPTGIPAMIMAGALQELEDDANHYLEKFSKGTLSLNFETQKETQKGKINEEIIVTINAPDGTREYSSFSGGQKFRIDLSIRIAMCKVSARRSGASAVETLFIDEGFGALDEGGKVSTLAALTELSEEMTVIAVSHIDGVKDGFPYLIETSLESGTTTIKQVTAAA